jgi:hypothetical protein
MLSRQECFECVKTIHEEVEFTHQRHSTYFTLNKKNKQLSDEMWFYVKETNASLNLSTDFWHCHRCYIERIVCHFICSISVQDTHTQDNVDATTDAIIWSITIVFLKHRVLQNTEVFTHVCSSDVMHNGRSRFFSHRLCSLVFIHANLLDCNLKETIKRQPSCFHRSADT